MHLLPVLLLSVYQEWDHPNPCSTNLRPYTKARTHQKTRYDILLDLSVQVEWIEPQFQPNCSLSGVRACRTTYTVILRVCDVKHTYVAQVLHVPFGYKVIVGGF